MGWLHHFLWQILSVAACATATSQGFECAPLRTRFEIRLLHDTEYILLKKGVIPTSRQSRSTFAEATYRGGDEWERDSAEALHVFSLCMPKLVRHTADQDRS